jgi:hypothetical protein
MSTKGEKRMNIPLMLLEPSLSYVIESPNHSLLIRCMRNVIPTDILDTLSESTLKLKSKLQSSDDSKRDVPEVYHFGSTRDCSVDIKETSDNQKVSGKEWVESNKKMWNMLNNYFKILEPNLYKIYRRIKLEKRNFGAWSNCALNAKIKNSGMKEHIDSHDFRNGYCWVVPFGDFTGGDIEFPELNLRIPFEAGDVIYFQSFNLIHKVNNFEGDRMSIVMYTHNNLFFPSLSKNGDKKQ